MGGPTTQDWEFDGIDLPSFEDEVSCLLRCACLRVHFSSPHEYSLALSLSLLSSLLTDKPGARVQVVVTRIT